MKKHFKNSISAGPKFSTPNPRPLTFLRSYVLTLFLFFLLPFAANAQVAQWNGGTFSYDSNQTFTYANLTGNTTVNVSANCTVTILGAVVSPITNLTLTKTGDGTLIVVKGGFDSPTLKVSGGIIQVGDGITLTDGSYSYKININGGTFRIKPAETMTYNSAAIEGAYGKLEFAGIVGKPFTIGSNINYTGVLEILSGELVLTPPQTVACSSIVHNGLNLFFKNYPTNFTYNGVISGSGSVKFEGIGNVTLGGYNTYAGQTIINSPAVLCLGTNGKIEQSAAVVLNGQSCFDVTAGAKKIKALESSSATSLVVLGSDILTIGTAGQNDGTGTFAGKFQPTGGYSGVVKTGTGTLTLTGNNTHSDTDLQEGTLVFSAANNLGTNIVFSYGGTRTLKWASGNTADVSTKFNLNGFFTATTNLILDVGDNNVAFASNFKTNTTTGKITKAGAGTLTIAATNTFGGAVEVAAGTLRIGNTSSGQMGNVSGISVSSGAKLRFEPGNTMDFNKVISGAGYVEIHTGASKSFGTNAIHTYAGTTTLTGTGGYTLLFDNGKFPGEIINNFKLVFSYDDNPKVCSNKISGTGIVQKWGGGGKLTLTGENTYTGVTDVWGTLQVGDGTSGSISNTSKVNIYDGAVLRFEPGGWMGFYSDIVGTGSLEHKGDGTYGAEKYLVLSGTNTYTGTTTNEAGSLIIGNWANGAGSIVSNSIINHGILHFDHGATEYTYPGVISGTGQVHIRNAKTIFAGNNTYEGTTTVFEGSTFGVGDGFATGSVISDIVNNGHLYFNRSDDYTYSGIISGTGILNKWGWGKLTLNGKNTYSDYTNINTGTLALGPNGSIESNNIAFTSDNGSKFDISAGDKKIRRIMQWDSFTSNEIVLGSSTLTVGFAGEWSSESNFSGVISGNGGITKTGSGSLTMNAENTAKGMLSLNEGGIELSKKWAGDFTQAPGTVLMVKENAFIDGKCALNGGKIAMDLTQETPSKLIVTGAVSTQNKTTLDITSNDITNYVLIKAASGLDNTSPFTVFAPGMNTALSANGTQLLINVIVTDFVPPVPGAGVNGTAETNGATLNWQAATDDFTSQEYLRYFVYQSSSNNITTADDCEANGILLNEGGTVNITTYAVKDLTVNTTYYFNVVVSDMVGNKAAYISKELKTGTTGIVSPELNNQITVYPNPTSGAFKVQEFNGSRVQGVEIYDVMG